MVNPAKTDILFQQLVGYTAVYFQQLSQICCQSSEINLLTRGKISEAGSCVRIDKSPGADNMSPKVLVELKDVIIFPLSEE